MLVTPFCTLVVLKMCLIVNIFMHHLMMSSAGFVNWIEKYTKVNCLTAETINTNAG